jgi:hypothetical protein
MACKQSLERKGGAFPEKKSIPSQESTLLKEFFKDGEKRKKDEKEREKIRNKNKRKDGTENL